MANLSVGITNSKPLRFLSMLAFTLSLVFGVATLSHANEPAMETVNAQAIQTLAASGQKIKQIDFGFSYSAAVTEDGSLYMWGNNEYGQLGDGTTTNSLKPQRVQALSHVVSVSLGGAHSAALTQNGELYTWGCDIHSQTGCDNEEYYYSNGQHISYVSTPTKVLDNVKSFSLEGGTSAAITKSDELYVWGDSVYGQAGGGKYSTDEFTPQKVLDNVESISLSGINSAAITKNGELYTWGCNSSGQLGDGTKIDRTRPVKVLEGVKYVLLDNSTSAAITENGDLYTWGYNGYGQLGDGTTTNSFTPKRVSSLSSVKDVSFGSNHAAAITEEGDLYTWGSNSDGQLGYSSESHSLTPTRVDSLPRISSVSLGSFHTTVITNDRYLYTWGYNSSGQLGNGTMEAMHAPQKVLSNVRSISLDGGANGHSIALTNDGELYAWGNNDDGQLGDGTREDRLLPALITLPGSSAGPAKQESSVALSSLSLDLEARGNSQKLTVGGVGDGELSAESSDSSIATATISSNTLTVSPVEAGSCTITVRRAETDTYKSSQATIHVTVLEAKTKDPSTVTLRPSQLALTVGDDPRTVSVGGTGDGELSAASLDTTVATAALNGTTLTVTPLKAGSCIITISRAETENYQASEATLYVSVSEQQEDEEQPEEPKDSIIIYRVFNRWSGEHIFTDSRDEYEGLGNEGWNQEGIAWMAPTTSKTPVYRLFNKWSGDHHYTTSWTEYDGLGNSGWKQEGIAFYSADTDGIPIYRLFNPYVEVGTHHYTTSWTEYDGLGGAGWKQESIGWYGLK